MAESWEFDTAVFNRGRRKTTIADGDVISAGNTGSLPIRVICHQWDGGTLQAVGRTADGHPYSVSIPKGRPILYYRTPAGD